MRETCGEIVQDENGLVRSCMLEHGHMGQYHAERRGDLKYAWKSPALSGRE